jgi:hypothetical protein
MSLQTRIKKIESAIPVEDSNLCVCADALSLVATPFSKVCFRCEREIKIETWTSWRLVYPTADLMFFAFGLRRDDTNALMDKPQEFFLDEIKTMLNAEI